MAFLREVEYAAQHGSRRRVAMETTVCVAIYPRKVILPDVLEVSRCDTEPQRATCASYSAACSENICMSTFSPHQARPKASQSTECDQILSVGARASPMLHRNAKSWRKELGIYATRFGRSA
jgi:hypothetical protein